MLKSTLDLWINSLKLLEDLYLSIAIFSFLILIIYYFYFFLKLFLHKDKTSKFDSPISIIICAKNEFQNLKNNLPLILSQNYCEFEVIVVNDHSNDESSFYLEEMSQKNKNLVVVFQPHRYSRTKILFNDFLKVLSKINKLYLLDTYSAGEKIIKGFETKDIFNHLTKSKKNIFYVKEKNLNKSIYKETNKKNLIIFMGAGSISKIASNFLKINE